MDGIKGKSKNAFNHVAHPHQDNQSAKVPDMVKKDQPFIRPKPPSISRDTIDKKSFDERWKKEVKKLQSTDPFDRIDQGRPTLTQQFNHSSKGTLTQKFNCKYKKSQGMVLE